MRTPGYLLCQFKPLYLRARPGQREALVGDSVPDRQGGGHPDYVPLFAVIMVVKLYDARPEGLEIRKPTLPPFLVQVDALQLGHRSERLAVHGGKHIDPSDPVGVAGTPAHRRHLAHPVQRDVLVRLLPVVTPVFGAGVGIDEPVGQRVLGDYLPFRHGPATGPNSMVCAQYGVGQGVAEEGAVPLERKFYPDLQGAVQGIRKHHGASRRTAPRQVGGDN